MALGVNRVLVAVLVEVDLKRLKLDLQGLQLLYYYHVSLIGSFTVSSNVCVHLFVFTL